MIKLDVLGTDLCDKASKLITISQSAGKFLLTSHRNHSFNKTKLFK